MKTELQQGWKEVEIQEIVDKTHPYPIGDGDHGKITPDMYQNNGIPYIRVGDMVNDKISLKNIVYISKKIHEDNIGKELLPDDIIIAKTGATIGKVAIIPREIVRANTTSSIGKITLDKKIALPKFVLYFIKTPHFTKQMWSVSKKSAQDGFNIKDLKKFKILLPPISAQENIISILEKAEKIKEMRDEADKLTKEYLKAVFFDIFGKVQYEEVGLKDLVVEGHTISYGIVQPGNEVTNGSSILRPVDIINNEIEFSKIKKISPEIEKKYQRTRLHGGEILMVVRGEPGAVVLTNSKVANYNVTRGLAVIDVDSRKIIPEYLLEFLKSEKSQNFIKLFTKGATLRQINLADLRNLPIPIPPKSIQKEFTENVKKIEKTKELQKQSKEQIHDLFNNIIQKSFKGGMAC